MIGSRTSSGTNQPDSAVSVLVCTRNRPADLERAVRSLLASKGVDMELIVVDQSDGPETSDLLERLPNGGRLVYVRSQTRGVSAAMEEGMRCARSHYIVRTDDDCEASPGWVAGMAEALRTRPNVALVFCNVIAAPSDTADGYTPDYHQDHDRLLRSVFATCRGRGIGAGMAFRRDAVLGVGGMDAALGVGGRFSSCEDWDIELRLLLRGWEVFDSAELSIVHHGFRTFAEGREHASRDWLGIGATLGKLVRAGHPSALVLAAWELGLHGLVPPVMDLVHFRRPSGLRRITGFCKGFAAALTTPVDRTTMRFAPHR